MSKDLFYTIKNSNEPLLPMLVQRISGAAVGNEDLAEIVNRLVRLLIGICIEAPSDSIEQMIAEIIDPTSSASLLNFAMTLMEREGRSTKAAERLITETRNIAAKAAEGKSVTQMRLLSPGENGEKAPVAKIVESIFELLLPFVGPGLQNPIFAILEVVTHLGEVMSDPTMRSFLKHAPFIADGISKALGAPAEQVNGVIALAQGKWEGATDLCKPFCDLDPKLLDNMMRFLPVVKRTVTSGNELVENLKGNIEQKEHIEQRVKQISSNVENLKGTCTDLFDLIDLDRNGTISLQEFRLCTNRLGFHLSEHRILEVFSNCKKSIGKENVGGQNGAMVHELNAEEFKQALDYLQQQVATFSLSFLGRSWGWLMLKLIYFCIILLLVFLFIFLAMDAFITGGMFNTIVNSAMTVVAGLAMLMRKEGTDDSSGEEQKKSSNVVEDITDMVLNDQ